MALLEIFFSLMGYFLGSGFIKNIKTKTNHCERKIKKQFQDCVNSKDRDAKYNALDLPSISLPKGEGALNGFDWRCNC